MNIFNGNFDVFSSKTSFGGRMHAFLDDYLDDISENIRLLSFSLFVGDLQFSSIKDQLDDLPFGLVGEEFVEISFLGNFSMRSVFVYLLNLQNFREILLKAISPIDSLISIAGYFKDLVVDFVADVGDVSLLYVSRWLLQHGYIL